MPQNMVKQTRMRYELAPSFCGFVPILATEPLWEPRWSSHRCS